ncbi:hypothetical protein BKA81DRAFT_163759 [Phyllosticta paracitricarpa]
MVSAPPRPSLPLLLLLYATSDPLTPPCHHSRNCSFGHDAREAAGVDSLARSRRCPADPPERFRIIPSASAAAENSQHNHDTCHLATRSHTMQGQAFGMRRSCSTA